MNKIRDLNFLSWIQPSAWMESMTGIKWNTLIKEENERFENKLKNIVKQEDLLQKADEFFKNKGVIYYNYEDLLIKYNVYGNLEYSNYTVKDLDLRDDLIYQIRDLGNGSEKYSLECIRNNKIIWTYDNIGQELYIKNNSIFVLKATNKLWYNSVLELNALTGKLLNILYEEKDTTFNLIFIKSKDTFFVIRDNYERQNLMIYENTLKDIGKGTSFYPIGIYKNKVCYFEYINGVWNPVGFYFPYKIYGSIEFISLYEKIYIERRFGRKTIYSFKDGMKPLFSYYGTLLLNPWSYKSKFMLKSFHIDIADKGIVHFSYTNKLKHTCLPNIGSLKHHFHKSYDSTRIPSITIQPFCKAKGLIVIAYGAYGVATNVSMWRWKPYLEDGWIISFIFVRGSGDHTKQWENDGKTIKKTKSIEDFETGISYLQKEYSISPKHTCIYGRSAGGYLIGSTVSRSSKGTLFKMVYTEVPYVDILRTTTNPSLPLTQLEYKEFGNPRTSIYEFQELLKLSPVDSLHYNNPPDLFVLTRTSENDSQVYTYEAIKWIHALRGKNKSDISKLVYISKNEGHFISSNTLYKSLAEDFFLLKNNRENG